MGGAIYGLDDCRKQRGNEDARGGGKISFNGALCLTTQARPGSSPPVRGPQRGHGRHKVHRRGARRRRGWGRGSLPRAEALGRHLRVLCWSVFFFFRVPVIKAQSFKIIL